MFIPLRALSVIRYKEAVVYPSSGIYFIILMCLFIFFCCLSNCLNASQKSPLKLKINLFCISNGKGLTTDKNVLQETLERFGCTVECIEYGKNEKIGKADINIFLQHLFEDKFFLAKRNWFIPNPEWYTQDLSLLKKVDLILCKTKEVERIFLSRELPSYYIGFTSPDCHLEIEKDFSRVFHLAGGSDQKGTDTLLKTWMSNLHYPRLTIVKHQMEWIVCRRNIQTLSKYLSQQDLRNFQNKCGIHISLSETEGFGHTIMEAMSAGCVVVTTDAPPMNELISDPRFLVAYHRKAPQRLAMNYYPDAASLKKQIDSLLLIPKEEMRLIGEQNRAFYKQKTAFFYESLYRLLSNLPHKK